MAQIFHRSTNTIARVSIYGAVILIALLGYAMDVANRSPYVTEVRNARPQPVPFSHKHHVGELGLDCRYCHASVEISSSAGMPSTSRSSRAVRSRSVRVSRPRSSQARRSVRSTICSGF